MAAVLKFVRGDVAASHLDLLGTDGITIDSAGWIPQIALPGQTAPITESMQATVTGSSQDDLAAKIQALHQMAVWAAQFIADDGEPAPVWLQAQMATETGTRQALVRSIQVQNASDWYGPLAAKDFKVHLSLAIVREPFWEALVLVSDGSAYTAGAAAVLDYSSVNSVAGDVPARIVGLTFSTWTSGNVLDRFWGGFRSENRHPGTAHFVPIWECEAAGVTLGTDATLSANVDASPGGAGNTRVTITPGTTAWAKRWSTRAINHVGAYTTENLGAFQWLLRTNATAGGTWEVQLRWGYKGPASKFISGPIRPLSGSVVWDYLAMGLQSNPLGGRHAEADTPSVRQMDAGYEVQIWARRTSGLGNLYLDCLVPIPADEGFFTFAGAALTPIGGVAGAARGGMGTTPDGKTIAYSSSPDGAGGWNSTAPVPEKDVFALPTGRGRLVLAWAQPAASVITDVVALTVGWLPRYLSLRGAA